MKKRILIAEVFVKGKDVPNFGLGKGVLLRQTIKFTDIGAAGFDSAMFAAAKLEHTARLLHEACGVRFIEKRKPK